MPEGLVFKGEFRTGAGKVPEKGEGGTRQQESFPDEAPGGSPAENQEICAPIVITSSGPSPEVFRAPPARAGRVRILRNRLGSARESETESDAHQVPDIISDALRLATSRIKLAKVKVRGKLASNLPTVYGNRRQRE
jgi:hypothetical protein